MDKMTPEYKVTREKIRAALAMQDCLNKASYHKQIEGK